MFPRARTALACAARRPMPGSAAAALRTNMLANHLSSSTPNSSAPAPPAADAQPVSPAQAHYRSKDHEDVITASEGRVWN